MFFGTTSPALYTVKVSTVTKLVYLNGYHDIIFDNLSFEGAGVSAFQIDNSKNVSIRNCNMDLSGTDAIVAASSPYLKIENSSINHSHNDAINIDIGCTFASIKNNTIRNTGIIPGLGKSGTGSYEAITSFGNNSLIEFNEIDSTGYDGIYFGGNSSTVKNNFIKYFCLTKDDGAGIYVGDWTKSNEKKIIGNIILNGKGTGEGTNDPKSLQAEGIYIDDNSSSVEILSNTVANCADSGIKIHNAHEIKIENNIIFDNGTQLIMAHDNIAAGSPIRNVIVNKNIFFSKTATQLCLNIYSIAHDIGSVGILNSNYYCRPINDNFFIQATTNIWSSRSVMKKLSLSEWQSVYNKDLNSKKTPITITDTNYIRFEYNPTRFSKTVPLDGVYIGVDGIKYSNTIMLQPYGSFVILKYLNKTAKNSRVDVGMDGRNIFHTTSDDSSKLSFGNPQVTSKDSLHAVREASDSIYLKPRRPAFTVSYHENTGKNLREVSFARPDISKHLIPATELYRSSRIAADSHAFSNNLSSETALHVRVYPNPATSTKVTIAFITQKEGKAHLEVHSLAGNTLVTQDLHVLPKENYISLLIQSLANGLYVLKVSREGKTEVVKLIVKQ